MAASFDKPDVLHIHILAADVAVATTLNPKLVSSPFLHDVIAFATAAC